MPKQETKTFADKVKGTKFEGKTEEQVKNALYSSALQEIRNRHSDEFVDLLVDSYAEYGLVYKPRLTEEQKAEQQVRALFAANPALAAKFAEVTDEEEAADASLDEVANPDTF